MGPNLEDKEMIPAHSGFAIFGMMCNTDFEEFFYKNRNMDSKKIVLKYVDQFEGDEEILKIKKEITDN